MDTSPGDRVQCIRDEYLVGILRGKKCPLWVVERTLDETRDANMLNHIINQLEFISCQLQSFDKR